MRGVIQLFTENLKIAGEGLRFLAYIELRQSEMCSPCSGIGHLCGEWR